MHIPENYLSPSTCGVLGAVMVPIWLLSIRKVKETVPREKLPLLGVAAAFSFLAMMFNVPLPGGTTGHAVGGTLIAILLGPYAACLSVSVALLIQALFFGDGGILAFGANSFNIAFALPFTGYFVYHGVKKLISSDIIAAGIGSYVGINVAAFCAAVEFGIQPLLFTDAAGQALYCPYPLSISIPAMMIGHITIFGLAEVIFTTGVLAYLKRHRPLYFICRLRPRRVNPCSDSWLPSFGHAFRALSCRYGLGRMGCGRTGRNGFLRLGLRLYAGRYGKRLLLRCPHAGLCHCRAPRRFRLHHFRPRRHGPVDHHL